MTRYAPLTRPNAAGKPPFRMIQVCAIEPWATPACSSRSWALAATTSAAASTTRGPARWSTRRSTQGITLFDTADIYGRDGGSEEPLGEALKGRRDQVVLATKFGHQARTWATGPAAGAKGGRGYIRRAVEKSLRRLQDRLHRPVPDAHPGPGHPDRRDPGRARRTGRPRARSATSATPTSPAGRSPTPPTARARPAPQPVHLGAEPLVAARARGRARGGPGRAALRPRRAAVLPAGQRPADRQGPPGPGSPGGTHGWPSRAGPATSPTPSSTGSRRSSPGPGAGRVHRWRSRSAASPPSRAAPR